MNGLLLVARRELAAYLNSLWGYAVIAAVLAIDGLLFNAFALGDVPKLSAQVIADFFYFSFGTTVIAAILLTMRLMAEERQTGTMVLLDASPLRSWQLVGGKYLSAMVVLGLMIALTLYMPALVLVNGKVSYGHLASGYLGLFLVAAAVAAIGTFTSTITRSQLVAGFFSAILTVFFLMMWWTAKVSDPPLKDLFGYLSLFDKHFKETFRVGQIDSEAVVFYLSFAFVFLMLASRFLTARRWR